MLCQEVTDKTTEYLERALAESATRQWESHVAACEYCARYVAQMRLTIRLIGRLAATRDDLLPL
jgi:anti-sigma factor RsiW